MPRLILASASHQRKVLLEGLGLHFEICPSGIDEEAFPERDPAERALLLSRAKARDVHGREADAWVIGCDTLVVSSDGTLLEKPRDADEAKTMLELHSGAVSLVHSGLCLIAPDGRHREGLSTSSVQFKLLSPPEITWWIQTGLWKDRSGGFQIDGPGQLMIERIEGDWSSIVGLPVFLLGQLMRELEAPFLG